MIRRSCSPQLTLLLALINHDYDTPMPRCGALLRALEQRGELVRHLEGGSRPAKRPQLYTVTAAGRARLREWGLWGGYSDSRTGVGRGHSLHTELRDQLARGVLTEVGYR